MFFEVVLIIILGLVIFNRFTVFTTGEVIKMIILLLLSYFLVRWFYIKEVKHKRKR